MDTGEKNLAPEVPEKAPDRLKKLAADLFDILEPFVFCTTVILLLFSFFFRPTIVDGQSMENTLLHGEYLLVVDAGYTPKNGDIVVAHNVGLTYYNKPLVKRVIATEGQTVDIDFSTWTLTVDGIVIDEPYRKLADSLRTSDFEFPLTVPEGCVFLMGDNRNHSADSRTAEIGMMDERCIVGKAVLRFFPLNRFTIFGN